MIKIRSLDELMGFDPCYVWAWTDFADTYTIWYWNEEGFIEQSPTDMAMYYRRSTIPADMFPMYVIPEPPDKPETVDSVPQYTVLYQGKAIEK